MTARTYLLRQNSEMRKDNIWNWTLPAWVVKDSTGKAINVCPQAGACVKLCYARNGTYRFTPVLAAHTRNLEMTYDLGAFTVAMLDELGTRRYRATGVPRLPDLPRDHLGAEVAALLDNGAAAVRVHDAGDFYSDDYLRAWLHIATLTPGVLFFAYTKEVSRMRRVAGEAPPNFLWCYSLGGREDGLIDLDTERHADVFPDAAAIAAAGYSDQSANDLLCVVSPNHRVGIPANNIKHFRKAQGQATFGQLQASRGREPRQAGLF